MADLVISALPTINAVTNDDVLILNDSNSTTTQITVSNLMASITFPQGSEAFPAVKFSGDINTGMWSPGADTLAFSTAGAGHVYIASDGAVGIDQDAPSTFNVGANNLVIGNTTDLTDKGMTIVTHPAGNSIINFADGTGVGAAAAGQLVYSHDSNTLHLDTAGTTALEVTNSQDIYIGTTTADQETRVAISGGCISVDDGSASFPILNFLNDLDSGFYRLDNNKVGIATGGTNRLAIDASGNFGLGTETPLGDIHINKPGATLIVTDSDATGTPQAIINASDGNLEVRADDTNVSANSKISGFVDGNELVRLVATGEVVVPNSVVFNEAADDVADPYGRVGPNPGTGEILIESDPSNLLAGSGFRISVDGTDALSLDSSGNLAYLADGTLTFGTDTDTYVVHAAPDTLQVYTGGSLALAALDDASLILSGIGKVDATNGKLLFGTVTPITINSTSATLQVLGQPGNQGMSLQGYGPTAEPQFIEFHKDRGAVGASAALQQHDVVGEILFNYAGSSSTVGEGAKITSSVTNTPSGTSTPGDLVFSTTAPNEVTATERLRISASGAIGISGTNYGTTGQVLVSSGAGSSPSWQDAAVQSVNGSTGAVVLTPDDLDDTLSTNKFVTQTQVQKLNGVESGATADQTGAEIKSLYEAEADTNAFTDALLAKLNAIEANANNLNVDSLPSLP